MDFKEFILAHDGCDIAPLAMQRERLSAEVEDWNLALSTLEARSKLRNKVPQWYAVPSLQYPKVLSAQQCSSTETARYKASLIFTILSQARRYAFSGKNARQVAQFSQALRKNWPNCVTGGSIRIADLTGGLGVDAWAFSQVAEEVLYNEMDTELCRAAEHNFRELGVKNIVVRNRMVEPGAVKEILGSFEPDVVFLDPARRGDGGRKVFRLEDCSPNVIELLPEIYDACPNIMLKLSPMADITLVCKQLPGIREVHVVATGGECKELLLLLEKGYESDYELYIYDDGAVISVNRNTPLDQVHRFFGPSPISGAGPGPGTMPQKHPESTMAGPGPGDKSGPGPEGVSGPGPGDKSGPGPEGVSGPGPEGVSGPGPEGVSGPGPEGVSGPGSGGPKVLFEPGKALLKAGAFDLPCEFGLCKLSRHTHLYVSQQAIPEELAPFGKCFEIEETLPFSGRTMKEAGKKYPKADVTARNIPMTSEELAKRLGVKPGDGTIHIFGTHSHSEGRVLIICRENK